MQRLFITSTVLLLLTFIGLAAPQPAPQATIKSGEWYELVIKNIPPQEAAQWNKHYKIDQNGRINLPLGGKVKIEGLTIQQAQDKLEKHLKNKELFMSPKITLTKI